MSQSDRFAIGGQTHCLAVSAPFSWKSAVAPWLPVSAGRQGPVAEPLGQAFLERLGSPILLIKIGEKQKRPGAASA